MVNVDASPPFNTADDAVTETDTGDHRRSSMKSFSEMLYE